MIDIVSKETNVLVQGITGHEGSFHAERMKSEGTRIVGGVTPGKGGQVVAGVPVFNSVADAIGGLPRKDRPTWSVGFVPAAFAKNAALEALRAGLNTVVITEHVPVHDSLEIHREATRLKRLALGPNCPGLIVPGQIKIGIMPATVFKPGSVGVVSRSGTLTYEVVSHLSANNLGQAMCVGIGGDPINLLSLEEVLLGFEAEKAITSIVMIGEIGGSAEERVARELIGKKVRKPIVAYLAGREAPVGTQLGHAGAIIEGSSGTIASKEQALSKAGVAVARAPWDVPQLLRRVDMLG
jgi:succinyl-CoA synthetase alpha subunit